MLKRKIIDFFASAGFVGHIPFASGTLGTIVAAILAVALYALYPPLVETSWSIGLAIGLTIFAIIISAQALRLGLYQVRPEDPSQIVIDEVAGFFVAVIGLAHNPINLFIAFLLFRVFDIWKPFPIRRLEKLPNGVGVVVDDVVAGLYACILLNLVVGQ